MTTRIGHNNGPAMDVGVAWRKHCWTKARKDLIPQLPIEILRNRVNRAKEIGLDYKTYASVRASTGRDVVGFLFSSNALRIYRGHEKMPESRTRKLGQIQNCDRVAIVNKPLSVASIDKANPTLVLDAILPGPAPLDSWSIGNRIVLEAVKSRSLPADGVLLIGDATLEREWSMAGRLAGYLPAERYFQNLTL